MTVVSFSTDIIPIVPFEDDDVNPGLLGRGLAEWLEDNLAATRFPVSQIIAEDWGYTAIIHREPYMLSIGLGGETDFEWPENGLTEKIVAEFSVSSVRWQLWVTTELGWLSRFLRKDDRKADAQALLELTKTKLEDAGVLISTS